MLILQWFAPNVEEVVAQITLDLELVIFVKVVVKHSRLLDQF
jgi:hypothetical protein